MDSIENRKEIRKIWTALLHGEKISNDIVNKDIMGSWEESLKLGINPFMKKAKIFLEGYRLDSVMRKNKNMIDTSIQIMDNLYKFVKGSGFLVMLCDKDGNILRAVGDEDIMNYACSINFVTGANWSLESMGTNAISMVLNLKKPVQVFAEEHFCKTLKYWTCSSAPIFYNEQLIGVLNMSAHYSKVQSHTLGMAVEAANAIESIMKEKKISRELSVTNDLLSIIMKNMDNGIIATDSNNKIIKVNLKLCNMLQLECENIINHSIEEIISLNDINKLKSINDSSLVKEVSLNARDGSKTFMIKCGDILNEGKSVGFLYSIMESKHVKNLVNSVSGSSAYITFDNIIGKNKRFLKNIEMAKMISKSQSTVLLTGESGTGKEMFAQSMHNESLNKNGPFIAVNCGAIPKELIASELFGYVEGAFTGARKYGNPGKFELAEGGTLFLDEIGDMPLDMQVSLLRVLENRVITRIGGSRDIHVNVRVIAATNKNLKKAVKEGKFREDLYYRLNVLTLEMIPLRERVDDIKILSYFFLDKYNSQLNKEIKGIEGKAIRAMEQYNWPGNVRELENVIERAVNITYDEYITLDSLNREIVKDSVGSMDINSLNAAEKDVIINALDINKYNITHAARDLGISKSTLYRKMRNYGIERKIV